MDIQRKIRNIMYNFQANKREKLNCETNNKY